VSKPELKAVVLDLVADNRLRHVRKPHRAGAVIYSLAPILTPAERTRLS